MPRSKIITTCFISLFFTLSSIGASFAQTYDLALETENGDRFYAVARSGGGPFIVAAGRAELDLLEGEAAAAAMARLAAPTKKSSARPRGVVTHKMDFDVEDGAEDEFRTRAILRRPTPDVSAGSDQSSEDFLLAGDDAGARSVRIPNAGEKEALEFIDAIEGLEPAERYAMKDAVGL